MVVQLVMPQFGNKYFVGRLPDFEDIAMPGSEKIFNTKSAEEQAKRLFKSNTLPMGKKISINGPKFSYNDRFFVDQNNNLFHVTGRPAKFWNALRHVFQENNHVAKIVKSLKTAKELIEHLKIEGTSVTPFKVVKFISPAAVDLPKRKELLTTDKRGKVKIVPLKKRPKFKYLFNLLKNTKYPGKKRPSVSPLHFDEAGFFTFTYKVNEFVDFVPEKKLTPKQLRALRKKLNIKGKGRFPNVRVQTFQDERAAKLLEGFKVKVEIPKGKLEKQLKAKKSKKKAATT